METQLASTPGAQISYSMIQLFRLGNMGEGSENGIIKIGQRQRTRLQRHDGLLSKLKF